MSFERVLTLNAVDPIHWSKMLPGQMTPKALRTFSLLSLDESRDYETIKRTTLEVTFRNSEQCGGQANLRIKCF